MERYKMSGMNLNILYYAGDAVLIADTEELTNVLIPIPRNCKDL